MWRPTRRRRRLPVANVPHPTFPDSADGTAAVKKANMKKMLDAWNSALPTLFAAITHRDVPTALSLYGDELTPADRSDIPSFDLPGRYSSVDVRRRWLGEAGGADAAAKRADITISAPKTALP